MYTDAMRVQTSLIQSHFGDSKRVKLTMKEARFAVIEQSAVFHAEDSMPFGDTEGLFDDVEWELSHVLTGSYGRGA